MNEEYPIMLDLLGRIAVSLEQIADYMAPDAPNWTHNIADFAAFDWSSIGATVVKSDDYGASVVEWKGKTYTRRSPENKFGVAIWYSRPSGKTEDGSVRYERLITFKQLSDADPISRSAEKELRKAPPSQPQPRQGPPPRQNGNGNGHSPDSDFPLCEWCGQVFSSPGTPCDDCCAKGATAASRPSQHKALDHAIDQAAANNPHFPLLATIVTLAGNATNQEAAANIVKSAHAAANRPNAEKTLRSAIDALKNMQPR